MNGRPFLILMISLIACSQTIAQPAPTPEAIEHFEKKVRPLLIEHCVKCHTGDKPKGGLRLDSRATLLKGGTAGPAIVPGDPAKSILVEVVKYDTDIKMPPKTKLRDDQIAAISDWVKAGAPWPSAIAEPAITPVKTGPLFTEEQKKFWAFQPIVRPPVPKVEGTSQPIDAFLRSKQLAAGLKPSPLADKRTLLRRVTFDLIGLPPTPEELDAFQKDDSTDAFAKVVDRLLASPAYGERWGRHWLDVARYADSNGLDENTAFANAWRYRDYVVRSFNEDKPFDRFLREQIAGDLLPASADPKVQTERLTALGYLALGAKVLAEPDKQKMMLDIADEQLDVLGKGIMGLTMGCARCHDHKFDPIPTRDYYSLLGIFTSTRTMQNLNTVAKTFERSLMPDTPEMKAIRTQLDAARKEVKKLEADFSKTPAKEKEKREEIHVKAEVQRSIIKKLEPQVPVPASVLAVEEGSPGAYGTQPRNLYIQARGNYISPTDEAPANFLRIIAGENQTSFVASTANKTDTKVPNKTRFGQTRSQSGRLELATWLTDPKHPLTARVFVNRVWQHHFGEGIVRSPDNFGRLGERPTHPELLDWLAAEFVANGWSVKQLHRRILMTDSYRQAGGAPPAQDPDNSLLSVYPRRRLEAEAIRDSILAVAGTLDRTLGGTLFPHGNFEYVGGVKYDTTRRSLYLPVIRSKTFDFLITFDFPDPVTMNGKRVNTVVAPQALFLMNNPFVTTQAKAFAARIEGASTDPAGRIRFAYRQTFLREPTSVEIASGEQFVNRYLEATVASEKDAAKRKQTAWAAFAQVLLASNEFVFVE